MVSQLWILALAAILALALVVWRAVAGVLKELPANHFGICSGMPGANERCPEEALTVWLAQYFDTLSGQREACAAQPDKVEQNKPLTFGDLRKYGIDLQVMTTCLTMGRPFRLPFRDDEQVRENKQFLYREAEFRTLFPASVVDWMVARERPIGEQSSERFRQMDFTGFRCLTEPDDLPVVVAVRMSLSFPILLSAIPLYSIDFRKKPLPKEQPERCWFTDGGVGSNFPIHFFDSALPSRPTFGLDLGTAEEGQTKRVRFPENNGEARLTYWQRFDSGGGLGAIAGFLGAVVNVAKDWNHEALSHLPGFRDRIGLIQLTKDEGGLNLTMPKERITLLTGFGQEAGREFVRRFGDPVKWPPGTQPSKMDWENHQLIRLRLLLASMAETVEGLDKSVVSLSGSPSTYDRFFRQPVGPTTYRFSGLGNFNSDTSTGGFATQAGMSQWMLQDLRSISQRIAVTLAAAGASSGPASGAPKPTPELKLRPRI